MLANIFHCQTNPNEIKFGLKIVQNGNKIMNSNNKLFFKKYFFE